MSRAKRKKDRLLIPVDCKSKRTLIFRGHQRFGPETQNNTPKKRKTELKKLKLYLSPDAQKEFLMDPMDPIDQMDNFTFWAQRRIVHIVHLVHPMPVCAKISKT